MKHYISILIFVLVCSFSNAQEKQNDATWQETVNFLNKYKSYFKLGFTYNNNLKKWDEYQIEHISITQESLYFKAIKYNYKKQKSKHIEVSIPFAKLQDIYSGFRQEISTVGNNISFKYGVSKNATHQINDINFTHSNKNNDALMDMIYKLLNNNVNYDYNRKIILHTENILEKIRVYHND